MTCRSHRFLTVLTLTTALFALSCVLSAQTRNPGSGSGAGQFTAGTDMHHDVSEPLRTMTPAATARRVSSASQFQLPLDKRGSAAAAISDKAAPELVNGETGAVTTLGFFNIAGVGNYFAGPNGPFTPANSPSDATGAVGTTQYVQWVDDAFAVFSKSTGNALFGPVAGNTIWSGFGGACETDNDGQPTVNFDKLANVWVVSQYAKASGPPYLQCVAVSKTDDATGAWNRYSFQIGYVNTSWINRDAKLGVWPDGYYMSFDMYSGTTFAGPKLCAMQRSQMLLGDAAGIQCIQLQNQNYNVVVSDLDSATPPPAGAPAYFAADDLNYLAIDVWKFHVDWSNSQNSTLSLPILIDEGNYNLACGGSCVPQPNGDQLSPAGSFINGRMPYRNYGSYQQLLATETVETVSNVRFYEMRVASNDYLYLQQEGDVQASAGPYRFLPSIAADHAGNIATAYNLSSSQIWPSQYVASRAPGDSTGTLGNETLLNPGNGSQTTSSWDTRATLTVDPVDDCTFYYTQQYQPMDGTNNWSTQIEDFTLAGCLVPSASLSSSQLTFADQILGVQSAAQTVTLSNTGNTALSISSIGLTGLNASSFVTSNNCGTSVAAGASCQINLMFDPAAAGVDTAALSIVDNAPDSPQAVAVSGTGVTAAAAKLSATGLSFGTEPVGGAGPSQIVTLTNTGGSPLTIGSISLTGPGASSFMFANTCGATLAPAANCTIHGHFAPTATGTLTAEITITDSASGSPQSITVSGTGVDAPVVSLTATSLSFGTQAVGTASGSRIVTLSNIGSAALSINSIVVTGGNASSFVFANTCGTNLAVGATCTIHGHFAPTAAGALTAAVTISDNAGNSPQSIALTGTGK